MNDHNALIARYLDSSIDAESLAQLQDWIAASPENAQYFMRRAAIHDALRDVSGARDAKKSAGRGVAGLVGFGSLAVAAAILLAVCGLAAYLFVFPAETEPANPEPSAAPIATLIETSGGGRLTTPQGFASEGTEYAAGAYTLSAGRAQFVLTNRVTVDLRGDTRLRMHSARNVSLDRGSAAFKVPAGASGFVVHLPDRSMVVDLGTAFRVRVDSAGASNVRVTRGTVAWTPPGEPEMSLLLDAGQTAHLVDGRIEVADAPALLAYHDFGGEPSPGHITTQKSLDETVRLIDHYTGDDTGVDLRIAGANTIDLRTEGETRPPAFDTPADELFGDSGVDLDDGTIVVGGNSASKTMTLTLAGLDPTLRYDLALYGDRDAKPDGVERFTLHGAASANNTSTAGVADTFNTELDTRPNATAGHVVRWSDIAPGADGTIEIRVQITDVNLAYLSALRLATEIASKASKEAVENESPETTLIEGDTR